MFKKLKSVKFKYIIVLISGLWIFSFSFLYAGKNNSQYKASRVRAGFLKNSIFTFQAAKKPVTYIIKDNNLRGSNLKISDFSGEFALGTKCYEGLPKKKNLEYEIERIIRDYEHSVKDGNKISPLAQNKSVSRKDKSRALFFPIIDKVAVQYQLDPLLVRAIIEAESGFNPKAVSKVGARGLMQLMPTTAKAMGVKDSFNPEHNIAGGVKYFKKLMDRFDGDIELSLAAYNAGSRKVRQYRGVPPFAATLYYIKKVCKLHKKYIIQKNLAEGNA